MSKNVKIVSIDYQPSDMKPILKLNTGKKLICTYNDGGESLKSTTRKQLEKLIGNEYKSEWYIKVVFDYWKSDC